MSEMLDEGYKHLKFVAGVFIDPETKLMEVHPGAEGVNPYAVMAGALENFAREALELAIQVVPMEMKRPEEKPRKTILRASGPLPPSRP